MTLPHVTSFCWCLGLEMGTKAIGFLHLLASSILTIVCIRFTSAVHPYVGTVEDAVDHLYTTWYHIGIAITVVSVCHILLACTLLYAAFNRKTVLLRVWLVIMCLLLACAFVFLIVSAAFGMSGSGSDIFLSLLEGLIFYGFISYCILVVFSYYLMVKSSEEMETPNKVDY